ncbi:MAG TPA: bifunctional glutamate N-acetyltransferase/amino-acid acetyltransferase ArgJ [Desulfobacteraceae bacterium]|nr:bifunctional glutamate N-acetyltransferase/amino-acid acetyltransferase ArgJ [Desulfobacteraceae bacterium]
MLWKKYIKEKLAVRGFKSAAVSAGLKKGESLDLGLIYSEKDTVSFAVFTKNRVKAAPVRLSMEHIKSGNIRAVICNSGNANACTGVQGLRNARKSADLVAKALGLRDREVIVASTGVIGVQLDIERIERKIPELVSSLRNDGLSDFSKAIMTTDTFPKVSIAEDMIGESPYRIVGIAKGAGMIMPHMATMLCFILSDISIPFESLKESLLRCVDKTFNRISVDGDTSTNDMVLCITNGMAKNRDLKRDDLERFETNLYRVMSELSKMIIEDGEGATKAIELHLRGIRTEEEGRRIAEAILNSLLVKCAMFGEDPNWGRIMAAIGRSGVDIEPESIDLWIGDVKVAEDGTGTGREVQAHKEMRHRDIKVVVDLKMGDEEYSMWGCDLSYDYVKINSEYTT